MRITQERSYSGMSEGYPRVSQDSPVVRIVQELQRRESMVSHRDVQATQERVKTVDGREQGYPGGRRGIRGRASEAGDGKAPGSSWGGRAGSEGRTRLPEWASRGLRGVGRS